MKGVSGGSINRIVEPCLLGRDAVFSEFGMKHLLYGKHMGQGTLRIDHLAGSWRIDLFCDQSQALLGYIRRTPRTAMCAEYQ